MGAAKRAGCAANGNASTRCRAFSFILSSLPPLFLHSGAIARSIDKFARAYRFRGLATDEAAKRLRIESRVTAYNRSRDGSSEKEFK